MKLTLRRCRSRNIVAIEIVMRALVFDDDGARRAPACARHHLLAVFRQRPVVERADQDQRRNAPAPGGIAEPAASRIEYRGGSKIRPLVARRKIWTHRPQNRYRPVGPAEQRDPVLADEILLLQPVARRARVGDALAIRRAGALRWRCIGDQDRANRSCRETAPHSLRPKAACPNPRFPVAARPDFSSGRRSHASRQSPGTGPSPDGRNIKA